MYRGFLKTGQQKEEIEVAVKTLKSLTGMFLYGDISPMSRYRRLAWFSIEQNDGSVADSIRNGVCVTVCMYVCGFLMCICIMISTVRKMV